MHPQVVRASLRAFVLHTALLLQIAFIACDSQLPSTRAALPEGFDGTIPNMDMGAYIFASSGSPFPVSTTGFGKEGEAFAVHSRQESSVIAMFDGGEDPTEALDLLRERRTGTEWIEISGQRPLAPQGSGSWSKTSRSAWSSSDRVPLFQRYPEVGDLFRLLPQETPSRPVAIGFVRGTTTLVRDLLGHHGPHVHGMLSLLRGRSAAFVVYIDDTPMPTAGSSVQSRHISAILALQTGYPGFIISAMVSSLAGYLGLHREVVADETVLYRVVDYDGHLMVKNYGSAVLFSFASTRDQVEALISAAVERNRS